MAEQRVVLVVNDGRGFESAVVFRDEEAAQEWTERQSPEVQAAVVGVLPLVSRRSVQREVGRNRGNPA